MPYYAVLDTETTGFSPKSDRVIEIAVIGLRPDGSVEGNWSTLLNPQRDLGPQHIHGIRAADVANAPSFAAVAGDLTQILGGRVIVGHNVSFDSRFLAAEFARLDAATNLAYSHCLCTMRLATQASLGAGRTLDACCRAVGVEHRDVHSALGDAEATAQLFTAIVMRLGGFAALDRQLGLSQRAADVEWPRISPRHTTTVHRGVALPAQRHYLQRLAEHLPDMPGDESVQAYLAALDRVLLDRVISLRESDALVSLAANLGIDQHTAAWINSAYLMALTRVAAEDGVITGDERADLELVATQLGISKDRVSAIIAPTSVNHITSPQAGRQFTSGLTGLAPGDMVVFTGVMSRPRAELEAMASAAGLITHGTITKKVRMLIAADPDSLSGKAQKAEQYGIPIVSEAGFMRLVSQG